MRPSHSSMIARFYSKAILNEEVVIPSCCRPLNMQDDYDLGMHFVALLKACTKDKDVCRGSALHTEIAKIGLLNTNVFVGSALVNMYIKCGDFERAQHVFDELPVRNVITWNALLSGYAQHGYGTEALNCYEQMQWGGIDPNVVTFMCVLKACGGLKALEKGQELHMQIMNAGLLEKDSVVANALIDMYSRCGALHRAQEVFDKLPVHSTSSWSTLISGYVQAGFYEEAWNCFEQSHSQEYFLNEVTIACISKACGHLGNLEKGQEIHAQVVRELWLEKSMVVGNALIGMYVNCGALEKAQEVLGKLSAPNLVTWTELIAGFAQHGFGVEAMFFSERLQASGFVPDSVTYASILKACGVTKALQKGKWVHSQLVKDCTLKKDVVIWSELVDMYATCGAMEVAQVVFDKLTFRDVAAWNVIIKGYNRNGHSQEALTCFEKMQQDGFVPSKATYLSILESCGILGIMGKAHLLHAQLMRSGLPETDVMVDNALVKMYMQCGLLKKARELFDELPAQGTVSWNLLIAGYLEHGHDIEALKCYEHMKLRGFPPNAITIACILKACSNIGAQDEGEEIYAQAAKEGLLHDDEMIANSLVDMYAKCGDFKQAEALLCDQPVSNVISWNALISGCIQDNKDEEAFTYFERMQLQGYASNAVTFLCMLRACANKGATFKGQEMHNLIVQYGLSEDGSDLGAALIVMYAKCGMLAESRYLFHEMPLRDVVLWTALIVGHALLGEDKTVLNYFNDMQLEGIQPNSVTYTTVLQTYRRRGLVDKCQMFFDTIREGLEFPPKLEHYICMIDLLGSAGFVENALALIDEKSDPTLWHTLLDACKKGGNAKLGNLAFSSLESRTADP